MSVSHSEVCLSACIFNYTSRDAALRLPRAATNNARSWALILIFTLSALAWVYQDFMGPLCLAEPVTTADWGAEVDDSIINPPWGFASVLLDFFLSFHASHENFQCKEEHWLCNKSTRIKCNTWSTALARQSLSLVLKCSIIILNTSTKWISKASIINMKHAQKLLFCPLFPSF